MALPLTLIIIGEKYWFAAVTVQLTCHYSVSFMNEREFVDFEDVAVLGQSNHRCSLEVDQSTSDIALAFSEVDWSVGVLAQEVHGCVSEGRV